MSVTNVSNAITTKQSLIGTGVATAGISSPDTLTYLDLYNTSLVGITLGGWMFILGLISIIMIVILNAVKIGGMLSLALRHKDEISNVIDKDVINKKE